MAGPVAKKLRLDDPPPDDSIPNLDSGQASPASEVNPFSLYTYIIIKVRGHFLSLMFNKMFDYVNVISFCIIQLYLCLELLSLTKENLGELYIIYMVYIPYIYIYF